MAFGNPRLIGDYFRADERIWTRNGIGKRHEAAPRYSSITLGECYMDPWEARLHTRLNMTLNGV